MDALSSLKLMTLPQATAGVNNPAQDATLARTISPAEMQSLEAGVPTTQSANSAQPVYSFQNLLGDFVNDVSNKQTAAGDAVNGLLSGKNVSLHQAVISMEEASVSFQMMVEVRNKLLDSYQELMRMQV
jgi:flagellar hook-basal body complex protein FliE